MPKRKQKFKIAYTPRVVFRDKIGRFLARSERYKPEKVGMIQAIRPSFGELVWFTLAERAMSPEDLPNVLSQPEFESLPEALVDIKEYSSKKKYKAWDIAEQIDLTKRVRRKDLKFTVSLMAGRRKKTVTFYHKIKRNTKSSYALFRRINQEIGLEGYFLYDRTPSGKVLADRTGRQVHLLGIKVEEVI
jgi:hypothetical protein